MPIGGGVGKIFEIGKQSTALRAQAYYNVEHPDTAPEWSLRITLTFIFPK